MYLSEMQTKEVISIVSGLNYGKVVDALVDDKGMIISFVAQNKKLFRKNTSSEEITFRYDEIEKIGEDVILVRV